MSNKKQQKLSFFMSKSKQGNEASGEERPPPTTSSGEERPPPTTEKASKDVLSGQPKRTYLPKWERIYSWLEYDDKVQLMTCRICKSKGRKNVFTTGSSNFKTSTLEDHQKTKDHQTAMIAPMLEKHMEKAQNKAQSDAEKGVLVALEAAYFLASENIALVKFKALIQFLRRVKAANINHLKLSDNTLYESSYSANEFVDAIAKVLEMELESKLAASPAVTVLADESTDIAVNKRLVLYAQITNPQTMQVSTEYITNVKITEGTGEAIADEIYRQLALRGVASDKIMGLGSDGASVMTGKGKGVTGMMLRKNPHLVNVHCVAHRLALCTSQAAENLPALKDFQETITAIYYYFKYSSCKQSKLAAIEKVLNTPQLKYKEVHSVRWLSFFDALETVFRTLEPLLTYLADTTLKDPKAVHLKKKVRNQTYNHP